MVEMDNSYWSERYNQGQTGWDIGYANPYLIEKVTAEFSKEAKILIPGAGNAHEIEALCKLGYTNVYALDWAKEPLENLKERLPDFPDSQLLHESFFDHQGEYDLVIEQTFFCALDPSLREEYVNHMYQILRIGGVLQGLLFMLPDLPGPPFGGTINEYVDLFSRVFELGYFHPSFESIPPRQGSECFFRMTKS